MIHTPPPKSLADNRLYRALLLRWADTPRRHKQVLERCTEDVLYWINAFAWQFNPKPTGSFTPEVGPFVTWPFQDRAVLTIKGCITEGQDLVIEKSRDMGVSWLCMLLMDHSFLFEKWKKYLVISRNEQAVDRPGDSDSLFWKLDYIHERLPDWMMRCDRTKARRKMGFHHPHTKSSITGQASTGKAGVGGRCTAMFIDEFSQIQEAYEVLQRTSDTTSCRILNGTHTTEGLAFAEITDSASAAGSFISKLQLHWTEHPDKVRGLYRYNPISGKVDVHDKGYEYPADFKYVMSELPAGGPKPGYRSPWYDDQCKRKGSSRAVAQDLDIDRQGGSSRLFDPIMLRERIREFACAPYWEGDLRYDPDLGTPLGLVPGKNGPLRLWVNPLGELQVPESKYGVGSDISTGYGASNSVVTGADSKTGKKVFELATPHMKPDKFAVLVVALCKLFKDANGLGALLAWEHVGPGLTFGKTLSELAYRRLFKRGTEQLLSRNTIRADLYGWVPNPRAKRVLLESYRGAIESRVFINPSEIALEECDEYRYSSSKDAVEHPGDVGGDDPSGARSNHGDRVIADALAWLACEQLGAGKPGALLKEAEQVEVGSQAWREQWNRMQARSRLDARPIVRDSRKHHLGLRR